MKKGFLVICISVLGMTASGANKVGPQKNSVDFAAPVVGSKTSLADVPAGQIVYEEGTGFWGLTTSGGPGTAGNWIRISPPIGSGTVVSSDPEHVERVTVASTCSSGSCTLTTNTPGITTVDYGGSTGTYVVNFTAGIFSNAPSCTATPGANGGITIIENMVTTTTTASFLGIAPSGTPENGSFQVICVGAQ